MKKTRQFVRKTDWLPQADLTFQRMKVNSSEYDVCVFSYLCVISVKLAFLFKCTFVCWTALFKLFTVEHFIFPVISLWTLWPFLTILFNRLMRIFFFKQISYHSFFYISAHFFTNRFSKDMYCLPPWNCDQLVAPMYKERVFLITFWHSS